MRHGMLAALLPNPVAPRPHGPGSYTAHVMNFVTSLPSPYLWEVNSYGISLSELHGEMDIEILDTYMYSSLKKL